MTEKTTAEGDDAVARQWALVQQLARTLAEPGQEPPRLVQTHISVLLFAGDIACKFKKPLTLPYLDFGTLAARRHFCEEELRINRRTAPQLYLDVVPVVGDAAHPRLGRPGDAGVLDWTLRMRRFGDGMLLADVAQRGALTPVLVDRLAAVLADFHGALPPSPAGYGRAETVAHWMLDNLRELGEDAACAEGAARLADWTCGALARATPLLEERRAAGFVRECHGDLHLANIVVLDGVPTPFDAIEFNPELRHIDVVSDLAFTFMDLVDRGAPWAAWRLVNGWAERTGDYAGLALLTLFAVYRAAVRAKVASQRARQHTLAADDTQAAHAEAARYLALAQRLAAPRPVRLVLTCGLSGSGKTTVSGALSEALGALRLRSDVERKRLFGVAAQDHAAPAELYSAEATVRTFDALARLACMLLQAGLPVIVDATFLRVQERRRFAALAEDEGLPWTLVHCTAPLAVLRARVAARARDGHDASDATEAVLLRQVDRFEPFDAAEQAHVVALDTDAVPEVVAERCRALAACLAPRR